MVLDYKKPLQRKNNLITVTSIKTMLAKIFLSKRDWFAFFLANLFWSMFWLPFLFMGWLTGDENYYLIAGGIFLFFAQPLIPMWIIIPLTTVSILKLLPKRK